MALIDLEWAMSAIRAFNGDSEATANDRLMHRIFRESDASAAERVVMVDKLWATQMYRWPQTMKDVIDSATAHSRQIEAWCAGLPEDALLTHPDEVARVALEALPLVMGHRPDGTERQRCPYSFASKFLHWTSPEHFPIMDSLARAKINRIQRGLGRKPRVTAGDGYWPEDYPRWIGFFSEAIGSLEQTERYRLLEVDLQTQPEPHRCRNTLLRVLDKACYWG